MARRPYNFQVKFGFVVEREGKIVHFCGYEDSPSQEDLDSLSEELLTDSTFGLDGKEFKIRLATSEELHFFREVVRGGRLMEGKIYSVPPTHEIFLGEYALEKEPRWSTVKKHTHRGINITVYGAPSQYGTIYYADNDYGEPRANRTAYFTPEQALGQEIRELDMMLKGDDEHDLTFRAEGRDDIGKLPIPGSAKRLARMSGKFSTSAAKPELFKQMVADLVNQGSQTFNSKDKGEKVMDSLISKLLDE